MSKAIVIVGLVVATVAVVAFVRAQDPKKRKEPNNNREDQSKNWFV